MTIVPSGVMAVARRAFSGYARHAEPALREDRIEKAEHTRRRSFILDLTIGLVLSSPDCHPERSTAGRAARTMECRKAGAHRQILRYL